jgi:hypothetical protein
MAITAGDLGMKIAPRQGARHRQSSSGDPSQRKMRVAAHLHFTIRSDKENYFISQKCLST